MRATVTGIDSRGQLFRDTASVVFLEGQKCVYESTIRPSPDGEVMVELPNGKEAWRSNAKVQSVSSVGSQPGTFRVAIELDRAHSLVIDTSPEETPQVPPDSRPAGTSPSPPAATESVSKPSAAPVTYERKESAVRPAEPAPPTPAQSFGNNSTENPAKPASASAPTSAPKTMVADIVRSVMASELAQLRREMQSFVANQMDAALRKPLETLGARIEQHFRKQPVITEESVRQTATRAAEKAQSEWASTQFQKIVTESVRAALMFEMDQRRREFTVMILGEIEAAVRGPIASRIDAKIHEHSRMRPPLTEETVRRLAAQVAENVQLEWASTKLQTIVAEAVRAALAGAAEPSAKETGATGGPPRR